MVHDTKFRKCDKQVIIIHVHIGFGFSSICVHVNRAKLLLNQPQCGIANSHLLLTLH